MRPGIRQSDSLGVCVRRKIFGLFQHMVVALCMIACRQKDYGDGRPDSMQRGRDQKL